MDFWKRAQNLAEEAAIRSQELTHNVISEASKRSMELATEASRKSKEFAAEASKRSMELTTEASRKSKEFAAEALKLADQITVQGSSSNPVRAPMSSSFNPQVPVQVHVQMPGAYLRRHPMSNSFEPQEEELITVRDKTHAEKFEKIHIEEAVCKICYSTVINEVNVSRTSCNCKLALIHDTCIKKEVLKACRLCQKDIEYMPVTLERPT